MVVIGLCYRNGLNTDWSNRDVLWRTITPAVGPPSGSLQKRTLVSMRRSRSPRRVSKQQVESLSFSSTLIPAINSSSLTEQIPTMPKQQRWHGNEPSSFFRSISRRAAKHTPFIHCRPTKRRIVGRFAPHFQAFFWFIFSALKQTTPAPLPLTQLLGNPSRQRL